MLSLFVRRGSAESDAAVRIEVAWNNPVLALDRLDAAYEEARAKIAGTVGTAAPR